MRDYSVCLFCGERCGGTVEGNGGRRLTGYFFDASFSGAPICQECVDQKRWEEDENILKGTLDALMEIVEGISAVVRFRVYTPKDSPFAKAVGRGKEGLRQRRTAEARWERRN